MWDICYTFQYPLLESISPLEQKKKRLMLCVKITENVSKAKGVCGVDFGKHITTKFPHR